MDDQRITKNSCWYGMILLILLVRPQVTPPEKRTGLIAVELTPICITCIPPPMNLQTTRTNCPETCFCAHLCAKGDVSLFQWISDGFLITSGKHAMLISFCFVTAVQQDLLCALMRTALCVEACAL